jgi:hypothetical protein
LKVRVTGEGLDPPLEAVSSISAAERTLSVPKIPSGNARQVEIRAYAGEPNAGGRVVSIGRSLKFAVPDKLEGQAPPQVTVFLRRVNKFSAPHVKDAPNACSEMRVARAGHAATLLPDGRVMISGGYQQNAGGTRTALNNVEFYDPQTGTFEVGPPIGLTNRDGEFSSLPRAFHTATLMNVGQVLFWGGENYENPNTLGVPGFALASFLLYDLQHKRFKGIDSQVNESIGRSHHAAILGSDGQVLIVGGVNRRFTPPAIIDVVERYNPPTAKGLMVPGVSLPRVGMSAASLTDGLVAVAAGYDGTTLTGDVSFFRMNGTEVVKVNAPPASRLKEVRRGAAAATFGPSNGLLLLGGYTDASQSTPMASSEIVVPMNDPSSDNFTVTVSEGPAIAARGDMCSATLPDGRVLIIGGRSFDEFNESRGDANVELIVPQADGRPTVLGKEALAVGRYHHTCTTLGDGSVLVLGGIKEESGAFQVLQDAQIFMPDPIDP